jgi:acyl carrier protein
MTRDEIRAKILGIFAVNFEIENPDLDENLGEAHEFDSIDAIELIREIELLLDTTLSRQEKESAMGIRTINQIVDYVVTLAATRA